MTEADFSALITRLSAGQVEFIVIGGVAATIQGSAHITVDLDVLNVLAELEALLEEREKS